MLKILTIVAAFLGSNALATCLKDLSPKVVTNSTFFSASIQFYGKESQQQKILLALHNQYGPIFKTEDGDWFIADAEMIREVLRNSADAGRNWEVLAKYLGGASFFIQENYIPEENESWETSFYAIAPLLAKAAIAQKTSDVRKAVVSALDNYLIDADLKDIPLDEFGFYMAYSSAMRFLFGYVPSAREIERIRKRADGVFSTSKLESPQKLSRMGAYLEEVAKEVQSLGEFHAAPDSLYMALKSAKDEKQKTDARYDDQWLRDQIKTLIWASFETTQSTAAAVLFYAARYPQYAEKVRFAYSQLVNQPPEKDPTILAFINEVLRLNPPIGHFSRIALRDFKMGDYLVPEGTNLVLNVHSAHRMKAKWKEPQSRLFRPDRKDLSGCTMNETRMIIPFGEGRRQCIGKYVALSEIGYLLGEMLTRYRLEVTSLGLPFDYDGNLRTEFHGNLRLRTHLSPN